MHFLRNERFKKPENQMSCNQKYSKRPWANNSPGPKDLS